MKLDVEVTIFTISPIADPMRGGRWCSLQFWRDKGTVQVRQVCDYKWRLGTPDGIDPQAEVNHTVERIARLLGVDGVVDRPRRDTVELTADGETEV